MACAPEPDPSPTGGINAPEHLPSEAVVLISFDGFRHDYLDLYETPTFDRLASRGVRAEGLIPPFPSMTFPSHYTIATGLHPEHHGIVGNTFLDPHLDQRWTMDDASVVTDGNWYGGEPIWVTAERQGMVAASYFWVGSEAAIGGVRPTHWFPYRDAVAGEEKVDQVLAWLAEDRRTRPRMITLYFPEVDMAGHRFGAESPEVAKAVRRVDGYLDRLIRGLALLEDGDRVNLVLVSDHGMAEMRPRDTHLVDLSGLPEVRVVVDGTYGSIFVDGSERRTREIRDTLRDALPAEVGVYLRAEVPERLHYSGTRRVGDIVVVPPLGHGFYADPARVPSATTYTHGWDPAAREMEGIFIAVGPRIAEGARIRSVESIHLYPFMARLLGLEPREVDGSPEVLGSLILDEPPYDSARPVDSRGPVGAGAEGSPAR